ncbi:MAG: hypothetical protein WC971_03585 [Coriobacteriia bacterium]
MSSPCVIIPTFWTKVRGRPAPNAITYDHPTPVDGKSTLSDCLRSLDGVRGLDKVVVIVAATEASVEHEAEDRVRDILADFPGIDSLLFGPAELGSLHRRLEQLEFSDMLSGLGLAGYGAVRDVGLLVAAVLGSEGVVFVDDDQIVIDESFLAHAMAGLGSRDEAGRPILAKSGYYVDSEGQYQRHDEPHWADMFWRQADALNGALAVVASPPRIKPSTVAFGGCLALHRDMYCNVSFDPWVQRGEDVDYVINARMHGADVFLDGDWAIIHQPPDRPSEAAAFRRDVYRFIYAHRKIEFAKSQVDLRPVSAESLEPYPGEFMGSSVVWRSVATALMRAISGQEPREYLRIAREALADASAYARANCDNYFSFQRRWPIMMDRLWEDVALKSLFTGERRMDRTAITGRFPPVRGH